jgi:hypothetical protein
VKAACTFVGHSGARYTFAEIEEAWLQPRTAGTFLYVRQCGDERTVLLVGDCHDLKAEVEARWPEATSHHGATHLYVRRNISSRVRQLEYEDMVRRFEPVMNEALTAATATEGR